MALSARQIQQMRGHPTAPGPRDAGGLPRRQVDPSPGNGEGAVPRWRTYPREVHADAGPGPTPSGPVQPGVIYEGEMVTARSVAADRERERQQTIQTVQQGGDA